jgi:hypothetical protein
VQRHGNGEIAGSEKVRAGLTHQHGEQRRQRTAAFVLERLNDVAQNALIASRRTSDIDVRAGPGRE